jgi:hypothetical protein
MAEIFINKHCDQAGSGLPVHTTGSRGSLAINVPPGVTQLVEGEIGIGTLDSDPAIFIRSQSGIAKLAVISHEGQAGQIEIATQQETDTGADDYRAVTPLKNASFSGTYTGTPTYTGDVAFTGNPTFTGTPSFQNIEVTGAITGSGGFPVGTIIYWAGVGTVPVGWLECDGSHIPADPQYTALIAVLGSNILPDCRSRFIRQGSPGTMQGQSTALPTNGFSATTGQTDTDHRHAVSLQTTNDGSHSHSASTNSTGAHTHSVMVYNRSGRTDTVSGSGGNVGNAPVTSSSAGAHSHSVTVRSAANHRHTVTGNTDISGLNHNHTVSISGGDSETRPANIQFRVLIKT